MQITLPDETPFIELAKFAHTIGCGVFAISATELVLLPRAVAQAAVEMREEAEKRRA